ncbi:hypothetical protein, partial [Tahibacter harae]
MGSRGNTAAKHSWRRLVLLAALLSGASWAQESAAPAPPAGQAAPADAPAAAPAAAPAKAA